MKITVTKSKLTQQSKSTRELNWPGNGDYDGRKRPNYGCIALRKALIEYTTHEKQGQSDDSTSNNRHPRK